MQIVGLAPGFADVEAASLVESGLLVMGVFIDVKSQSFYFYNGSGRRNSIH